MALTRIVAPGDPEFPPAMAGLPGSLRRRPLHVRGPLARGALGVAIVGTRRPSRGALAMTAALARAAAGEGYEIWSGGALGIDAAAHEAALAAGARTVVVTAGGLDDPYPAKHAPLYQRVLEAGGTLISLEQDGTRRKRFQFLRRNYVIVALTIATLVVQARESGGARHAASAARRLRRRLLAVPDAPWSTAGCGSALEIAAGATAVADADDLLTQLSRERARWQAGTQLDMFGVAPLVPRRPRQRGTDPAAVELGETERRVLEALGQGPTHPDRLCDATGLPYRTVSGALLALSLEGVVLETPPGHYRRFHPLE
jgi:DNA processing protein